ncbi:MAG: DUF4336 domain-containing protein [Phormidesmis sp.]
MTQAQIIEALDNNLWIAEQPLRYFGLEVGTRMTVIRLSSGALAVISPVEISDRLKQQLDSIGPVKHIVAPNLYHYFYATGFKNSYPTATFWATTGLKEKKPNLPVDRVLGADGVSSQTDLWTDLEGHLLDGYRTLGSGGVELLNEWVFFHAASRTLILTDAAFHFDQSFPLITQLAARVGGSYQRLGPSLIERVVTTDKARVKASMEKILSWDFERVVMAHGTVVERDGKRKLAASYDRFLGPEYPLSAFL